MSPAPLAMLAAATAAGVRRFVFVSSLAAREPQLSMYGASKARAEALVERSGLDWSIVRPPAVYGPGDRETLELFKMARLGLVLMPPAGRAVAHPRRRSGAAAAGAGRAASARRADRSSPTTAAPAAGPTESFAAALGRGGRQRPAGPVRRPPPLLRLARARRPPAARRRAPS